MIKINSIFIELTKGKMQEYEPDISFLSSQKDLRDFVYPYSRYWTLSKLEIDDNLSKFPIARISWEDCTGEKLSRYIDGVHYIISGGFQRANDEVERALSQIGKDGAKRLLISIGAGRWPSLTKNYTADGIGDPMIEALPQIERDKVLADIAKYSISSEEIPKIIASAWYRCGVKNFNTNVDGYIVYILFLTRRMLVQTLAGIVDGKIKAGAYVCPHCGKDDILSKSGFSLHIKKCKQ